MTPLDAAAGALAAGRRLWFASAVALSSILLVILVTHLPVGILSDAGHDDAWFWLRADAITAGDWLGRYDQLTLMKGSGYPLFLALVHALGVPLGTAQAVLYAGACVLLGTAVPRMGGRPWLALVVVLALQWHPSALAWTRVLRDSIGASQVLLLLACVLHFLCVARAGGRGWGWAASAGLVLAWTWTTREDAIWILPGVALLLLAHGVLWWRDRAARRRLLAGVLLMAAVFAGWLSLVATTNLLKYGVFATVETRESAFPEAMAALQRVRVGDAVPYVPVPRDVREAVYAESPAFARLRPWFEDGGRHWTRSGCGHYPHACGDYAGGWFMWAFRDGVASIGGYRSAPAADAFYRQLAGEVQAACTDGRLQCARTLVGALPPVTAAQWRTVPARARSALAMLLWQGVGGGETPSHLGSRRVTDMWQFVGRPRVPDAPELLGPVVVGWFRAPSTEWLRLRCAASDIDVPVPRLPSPDLARHFGDAAAAASRFAVVVPSADGCVFQTTAAGAGAGAVRVADVGVSRGRALGAGQLHVDGLRPGIPADAAAPRWARSLKSRLGLVHRAVLPSLALAGLLAFAWATVRCLQSRRVAPLYLLAAAAWVLAASRLALLVLVDMSSFPAIKVHYMQPAYALLTIAVVASLALPGHREAGGNQVTAGSA